MLTLLIVGIGLGLWARLLLVTLALCRAARVGDDSLHAGISHAARAPEPASPIEPVRHSLEREMLDFDLAAHPRPTRQPASRLRRTRQSAGEGGTVVQPASHDRSLTAQTQSERSATGGRRVVSQPAEMAGSDPATVLAVDTSARAATLTLREAADALQVPPHTLVAWEARYGYPASFVRDAQERRYSRQEVDALATRLQTDLSVAAAIEKARLTRT